jgi:DNA repair exonuclease SbcCD ATPase subunit
MKIISLEASNVLKIDAIEIVANGKNVTLTGANATGKTSVLKCISMAMGGADEIPDEVIHKGAKKAHIDLDLGEFRVKRTFTAAGGGTLTVTGKDNVKYPSPQAVLDGLVGQLTFDPLAFTRLKADKQAETLRNLVGLDFTEIDREAKEVYDKRTVLNREIAQKDSLAASLPRYPDMPAEEQSVEDIVKRLRVAEEHNRKRDVLKSAAESTDATAKSASLKFHGRQATIAEKERELDLLRMGLTELQKAATAADEAADKASADLDAFTPTPVDDFLGEIANLQETNRKVRANETSKVVREAVRNLTVDAERYTDLLEELATEKRSQLESAKMPVEGLAFTESGVTYKGLPFAQASAAEQLRVSAAMGMALNPRLKVLMIRDASLLDADSMAILKEMAGDEWQLWLEVVGAGKEVKVIIEEAA